MDIVQCEKKKKKEDAKNEQVAPSNLCLHDAVSWGRVQPNNNPKLYQPFTNPGRPESPCWKARGNFSWYSGKIMMTYPYSEIAASDKITYHD